ncbi:MAG TPA: hypothetical protein VNV65_02740 [Candidatus Solibacter sp.]|nr:hypothetical protein [Candidatus Solibacter sp.]
MIGLIAFLIVAKRASGMLPLTAAAQKRAMRPTWIGLGLLIASIVLFFVGAGVSDSIGGAMILVASVSFIAGLIVLLVRRSFDIGAKVVDVHFPGYAMPVRAIDFKRAHPAFVAAVQQMYVARAVAPAPAPPPPFG